MKLMTIPTSLPKADAFIARSMTCPANLADARSYAWEVLRRRADFEGAPATVEQIRNGDSPIELIRPQTESSAWGLRFR